jgi:hypothetical protein
MTSNDFLRYFMRSPLGLGLAIAGISAGITALSLGSGWLFALVVGFSGFAALSVLSFLAGFGGHALVAERERSCSLGSDREIRAVSDLRDRLCALRVADREVSSAIQYVGMAAGEYIDACRRAATHDPNARQALEEALSVVSLYLEELDDSSKERRFGQEDTDPFINARERVIASLKDKALALKKIRTEIQGGLTGEDRMSVDEELR